MFTRCLLIATVAAISAPAMGQPPVGALAARLRALDASFTCPEFLSSDEERRIEVSRFAQTLAAARLTYAQARKVRANFLSRHNCGRPGEPEKLAASGVPSAATQTVR